MSEILKFAIQANSEISATDMASVDFILENFAQFCHSNTPKKVNVHPQNHIFRGKSPNEDYTTNIPIDALVRYIPNTGKIESPFNEIERAMFFYTNGGVCSGFLFVTYNIESIENHKNLNPYDLAKYGSYLNATKQIKAPLLWIELVCVKQESRGQNIAEKLIDTLKKDAIDKYFTNKETQYIVIGIDIAGTKNNWMNQSLSNFYEKLGFKMSINSGFDIITSGGQIGYLQIKRTDI